MGINLIVGNGYGRSADADGIGKIPSPGGKVARPSASEEKGGRKRNAGGNLPFRITYQTYSQAGRWVEVFRLSQIVKFPPAFLFSQLR